MPLEWFGCFMVSEWGEMKPSAKWTLIQEKTNPRSKHSLTMPYLDLLCIFSWNVQRSPGKVFPLIPVHAPRQGVQLENVKGLLTETMTRNAKKWKNRKNETSQNITRLYKIASWFFFINVQMFINFYWKFSWFSCLDGLSGAVGLIGLQLPRYRSRGT